MVAQVAKPPTRDTTVTPLPIQTGRVAESNRHGNAGLVISLPSMGETLGKNRPRHAGRHVSALVAGLRPLISSC